MTATTTPLLFLGNLAHMDLFCPHCTRRVTVPDDKAGLIVNCPLCMKQFMTPSLVSATPPAPKPPPPPPPPPSSSAPAPTYGASPPTVSSDAKTEPWPAPSPSQPAAPPPPPPPPGDYTRSFALHLRGKWLAFVPLACLVLIFVLTFLPWHQSLPAPTQTKDLWRLVLVE